MEPIQPAAIRTPVELENNKPRNPPLTTTLDCVGPEVSAGRGKVTSEIVQPRGFLDTPRKTFFKEPKVDKKRR